MKKVLLINPPLYYSNGEPKSLDVSVPPLGLLYLASYINDRSAEFEAEIIDVSVESYTLDELIAVIKKKKPFVVGLSCMTPQLQGLMELARALKKRMRGKGKPKVFLGGPHISADRGFIKRHTDLFDYAITGEAEVTFLASLNKLAKGRRVPKLQESSVPMDLNALPAPDRLLIKRDRYKQDESMMFGRGCPFRCYYCSRPSISKMVRYRSIENIIDEIKDCYKDCAGHIHFQDDTFTMKRDVVMEFCKAVKKEGLKLYWDCNTRIDLVDARLLKAMSEAGCVQINFGIESGNERVRKEIIHKGRFTNKRIMKVFDLCRKYNIRLACYFMIGHPTETEEELLETKDMILHSNIDILGLSIPTPFPGSDLYDIAKKEGIVDESVVDQFANKELGEGYAGVYPVYQSPSLSLEFVYREYKDINRKFYLNFKTFWKKIKEDLTSFDKLRNDAKDMVSLVIQGVSSRRPYRQKDVQEV
jgi:radical SAM superfamily enzyme YgiQ (UPF0313 family)